MKKIASVRLVEIDVGGFDDQVAAAGHGVAGIDRQGPDDLLHLAAVDSDRQKCSIQNRANQDILADEAQQHGFHLGDHGVEIDQGRLNHLLPAEG